jgi:alpha-glutamyl/putrescinyl thymine pyrophosphorylase clade 1
MQINETNVDEFVYWINERERVRQHKEANDPKPWSPDVIFQKHHFCNVHREDDRGTKSLKAIERMLTPAETYLPTFWTAARMFNHSPSLKAYWEEGVPRLKQLKFHNQKIFNTAYVVSTCGKSMDKIDYVHGVVQSVRNTPISPLSCAEAFRDLRKVDGLGSFMCGQIIADLKYTPYLKNVPDWHTFAVMGPGSQKGLNLIFGAGTTERNFTDRLLKLRYLIAGRIPEVHNQDLQNCLCEFSKYMRYKHNLPGRRRNYP